MLYNIVKLQIDFVYNVIILIAFNWNDIHFWDNLLRLLVVKINLSAKNKVELEIENVLD